ncbi:unnamed protein product [Schistosoma rodhaini]|uniref:Riboflavin transporter n=1 Tax=Schistosoma rodhaini TaxID=6188 RepID=A0AA85EPS0_9TREM|nr:unnamed protein product [Schistosoma rodhaini]CAH8681934.1 unnamed protein product [Schistosoma rodhaini]
MVPSENDIKFTWLAACLVSLYGLGSWIVVNGLWVELPLLVNVLPEGWSLPAYLIIIVQVANVGPVIYVPLAKLLEAKTNGFFSRCLQPPERIANYLILAVGLISCILISQFWNSVAYVSILKPGYYSIGLFVLALFASIVDCTSSVTFITYLNGMPQLYVGALHFGEAFSDLVPSTLALIQGVGSESECINKTGRFIHEHYRKTNFIVESNANIHSINHNSLERFKSNGNQHISNDTFEYIQNVDVSVLYQIEQTVQSQNDVNITKQFGPNIFLSCLLIIYISASNYGFLPAIQSYSCAAYGSLTYHLAVTLSGLCSAIMTVLTTFLVNHYCREIGSTDESTFENLQTMNRELNEQNQICYIQKPDIIMSNTYTRSLQNKWISISLISLLPVAYVVYLASSSPNPPYLGGFGSASAILAWIAIRCLFASLRTWIWMSLSSHSNKPTRLRLAGLSTQFGAALGAILGFILVVYFQLFRSKLPCIQV